MGEIVEYNIASVNSKTILILAFSPCLVFALLPMNKYVIIRDGNCCEIISYPGPMPPLSKDNIGKITSRRYRNSRIGDFFKELKLTEGKNTGILKIARALNNNQSPPAKFETDDLRSYFTTTLFVHSEFRNSQPAPDVTPQATPQATPQVLNLLKLFNETENLDTHEISKKLNLKDRKNLRKHYINPALEIGVIEYTIPEKPRSPKQKYRLTQPGKTVLAGIS